MIPILLLFSLAPLVKGQESTSWPCAVYGAAYGNILGPKNGHVQQWAPLVGKACADSTPNTCYSDASEWSSVAIQHGNRPVSSVEECASLCAQEEECDVWTFWPSGAPSDWKYQRATPKCDLCPASQGGGFDRKQVYCENDQCSTCDAPYDYTATNGVPADADYNCDDARAWFANIGCCVYDVQAQASYQAPATCELYRAAPNHSSVLGYGVDAISGPKDCSSTVWLPFLEPVTNAEESPLGSSVVDEPLPLASDGRLCWVDNASYGSIKDGACDEADIIIIYTQAETIALGQSQGWWKSPVTGQAIQPIPYNGAPYTVRDCHQACIDNPLCGGWQYQDKTCVLKAGLECTPSVARAVSSNTVAGISGCVDISSNNVVESAAVDTSDLWFMDCDRPRCTQPHNYGGRWAGDTYVPDFTDQDACWYKQYTPDELFGGCTQDRWIVINGGSNSLSFFIQMVNLFAPLQRVGDPEPLVDYGYEDGVNLFPMVDIVFRSGSLPILDRNSTGILHMNRKRFCDIDSSLSCYNRSLALPDDQVDWPPAYGAALDKFLAEAPYEAGATRITLVVGQFWSAAREALRSVGSVGQSGPWAGKNVLFYGQAMTWYACNVDGWCNLPALGSTTDEMLSKYRSDVDEVISAGNDVCDLDHVDCFFATAGYGSSPGYRARGLIEILEEMTASYNWANFIDYNGFMLDEEIIGGHLMPSMFLPVFAMLWNTVCDGPSIGCPQAITSSPNCWMNCEDRRQDASEMCSSCFDSWECANEVQCDAQTLDLVPWHVATLVTSNSRPDEDSDSCGFVRNGEDAYSCKNRIWCGTVAQGWIVGVLVFVAGLGMIALGYYYSIRVERKQKKSSSVKSTAASPPPSVIAVGRTKSPSTTSMSAVSGGSSTEDDTSANESDSPTRLRSSSNTAPAVRNNSSGFNFVTSVGNDGRVSVSLSSNHPSRVSKAVKKSTASARSPVCVDDFIDSDSEGSGEETNASLDLSTRDKYVVSMAAPVCVDDFIDSNSVMDKEDLTNTVSPIGNEQGPAHPDVENPALKPDKPNTPPKDYLRSLGMARLLASVHIVLGHLYAKGETANVYFFGWGFTWVPWFFMLSGYVLTHARLNSRDPTKVDGPYSHIAKRLSTIFPMYSFGVFLSMLIVVLRKLALPGYDVLIAQSYLLQSWVPLWVEEALLSHCWFLSNMVVYWAGFGWVYKGVRRLTLASSCYVMAVICVLPWFLVIIPAISDRIEADWYKEHTWGSTDSATDTWTVMLKFHPVFYAHVFLFGMLLSVLRHQVKTASNDTVLVRVVGFIMRFGATLGYIGLVLVFSLEQLQPSGYKLSARLSVLLPLQGLVLLGLSPLPQLVADKRLIDPLAYLFSFAPQWIGDVSYCQYILQFIMYNLFPTSYIGNSSFFFYLLGAAMITYKLIQEPAAKVWRNFLPKNDSGGPVRFLPSFAIARILFIPPSVLAVILVIAKSTYHPSKYGASAVGSSGSGGLNPNNSTNVTSVPDIVRIAPEAVDLKLDWTVMSARDGGSSPVLINPSILFQQDANGNMEWIRAARVHAVEEEIKQATYEGQVVTEQFLRFRSEIALSQEPFGGDLSVGFDDEGVKSWGLGGDQSLSTIDSRLISHVGKGAAWNDLCEPKPSFNQENSWLVRKQVSGPEDPKLFQYSSNSWGITFSSFPPASLLSEGSSQEECKWSDEAVMQMYLTDDGMSLASGGKAHGTRLHCGNPTDTEKNWIAFSHDDSLYYVYSIEPHVVVQVRTADGECVEQYKTSSGELSELAKVVDAVRGSATAIRYSDTEYLALLHTTEPSVGYSTRAYTFEAKPPFSVRRVSSKIPLQGGGRAFPSSLSVVEDKIIIGYGHGDSVARAFVMSRAALEDAFDRCNGF